MAELGVLCRAAVAAMSKSHATTYDAVIAEIDGRCLGREATVEDVLDTVHRKIAALTVGQALGGTTREQFVEIDECLRKEIATAAMPDDPRIPSVLPHHSLARWIGQIVRVTPVEVFTTNYDTLLERGLEDARVPYFDGFVGSRKPFFLSATLLQRDLAPGKNWTRLWKIHGSVNWRKVHGPGGSQIVRGAEGPDGALIYPALEKYDESRKQPYVAMLDRLARFLDRDAAVLVTIGYSFSDQHINEIIFEALSGRPRAQVVALCFNDPDPTHDLVRRSLRNLSVYGRRHAVVGGLRAEWRLVEEIDARYAGLLDGPFEPDAVPDPKEPALSGTFRLGDFSRFARFLDAIAAS